MKKIIINKDNLNIFIIISLVFIISSNLAWLNPRPDFYVYKIFEYMPLFWQYNHDAPTELLTAAYFPYYFEEINIRVSRPGYPILIKLISTSISLVISPFYQMSQLYYAGIGFLILKFLIYLISAKLLFEVTKKYFNKIMAYVLIIVFYFHYHSILYATTFHTSELAFIIPIFISYLFINLKENYSLLKNLIFSIIVGCLMLCRPDYAIYLCFLIIAFLNKNYNKTIISFMFHLIPIGLYIFYLSVNDIKLSHYGISDGGYFGWIINEAENGKISEYVIIVIHSFYKYFTNLISYYTISFVFFVFGMFVYKEKLKKYNNFIVLYFVLVWFQTFITNRFSWGGYMVADLSILIFPISILGLNYFLIYTIRIKKLKKFINSSLAIYCIVMSFSYLNLPWVHPYNQLEQKYDKKEFINLEIK